MLLNREITYCFNVFLKASSSKNVISIKKNNLLFIFKLIPSKICLCCEFFLTSMTRVKQNNNNNNNKLMDSHPKQLRCTIDGPRLFVPDS